MSQGHHLPSAPLALCLALASCSTVPPPGFAARRNLEPVAVHAEPGTAYGFAPRHWVTPDGDVSVDVDRASVTSGFGGYDVELDYSVAFDGRDGPSIRCTFHNNGAGQLACDGARQEITLRLGPGCHYPDAFGASTCRRTDVTIGPRRFRLLEGHVETQEGPSGHLSLIDDRGAVVAAANIATVARIQTWLPNRDRAPAERDAALLLITAYHQWRHHIRTF